MLTNCSLLCMTVRCADHVLADRLVALAHASNLITPATPITLEVTLATCCDVCAYCQQAQRVRPLILSLLLLCGTVATQWNHALCGSLV